MNNKSRGLVLLFPMLTLVGCHSGGGGFNPSDDSSDAPAVVDAQVGGIWVGTTSLDLMADSLAGQSKTELVLEMIGIVAENGHAQFITDEAVQISGQLAGADGQISGPVRAFAPDGLVFSNGEPFVDATLEAALTERETMDGSWEADTGDGEDFFLDFNPIYERGSSLEVIAGSWVGSSSLGAPLVITIDDSGQFTGQIGNGCVLNGQVGIIDADFNAYDLQLSVDNCTDAAVNGDYAGLGATHDATGDLFDLFEDLVDVEPKDGVPDCKRIAFLNTVPDKERYSCYAVNEVEVKDKEGTDKEELKIKKAEVSLPDGRLFDPNTDMVQVRIGGLTFDIPPGSFQRKGRRENFEFKSPKGARPNLKVHLHLYRDQWDLKWKHADVSMLDCDDGCQVSLMINGFESFQEIQLDDEGKFMRNGMPPVTDDAFTIGADNGENAVILHLLR